MPEILSLVEAICRRPAMYTLNGTFGEAACFLEGFYTAESRGNVASAVEWGDFQKWLKKQLHHADNVTWFAAVWNAYADDAAAIDGLAALYARYQAEGPGNS